MVVLFIFVYNVLSKLMIAIYNFWPEQKDVLNNWRLGGNQFLHNALLHNGSAFAHRYDFSFCLEQLPHLINHNRPSNVWFFFFHSFPYRWSLFYICCILFFIPSLPKPLSFHSNSFHFPHVSSSSRRIPTSYFTVPFYPWASCLLCPIGITLVVSFPLLQYTGCPRAFW